MGIGTSIADILSVGSGIAQAGIGAAKGLRDIQNPPKAGQPGFGGARTTAPAPEGGYVVPEGLRSLFAKAGGVQPPRNFLEAVGGFLKDPIGAIAASGKPAGQMVGFPSRGFATGAEAQAYVEALRAQGRPDLAQEVATAFKEQSGGIPFPESVDTRDVAKAGYEAVTGLQKSADINEQRILDTAGQYKEGLAGTTAGLRTAQGRNFAGQMKAIHEAASIGDSKMRSAQLMSLLPAAEARRLRNEVLLGIENKEVAQLAADSEAVTIALAKQKDETETALSNANIPEASKEAIRAQVKQQGVEIVANQMNQVKASWNQVRATADQNMATLVAQVSSAGAGQFGELATRRAALNEWEGSAIAAAHLNDSQIRLTIGELERMGLGGWAELVTTAQNVFVPSYEVVMDMLGLATYTEDRLRGNEDKGINTILAGFQALGSSASNFSEQQKNAAAQREASRGGGFLESMVAPVAGLAAADAAAYGAGFLATLAT